MLSDKGPISKPISRFESRNAQLVQKHSHKSSSINNYSQNIYTNGKVNTFKRAFTTILKSVTGYFKAPPAKENKKITISCPSNFIHFGHAGIDPKTGEFDSYANNFTGHIPDENLETIMSIPTKPTVEQNKNIGPTYQLTQVGSKFEAKRREISAPLNLLHITHVSISTTGEFIGLPKDWQALLKEPSLRC